MWHLFICKVMQECLGVLVREGLDSCTSHRDVGLCMEPKGLCWGLTGRSTSGTLGHTSLGEDHFHNTWETKKFPVQLFGSKRSCLLPIVAWFVVIEFSSCASFWLSEAACMYLVCDYEDRMLKNSGGRAVKHQCFSSMEDFWDRGAPEGQKKAGTRLGKYFHGSL